MEVTKLSLLLKVLEGETDQSITRQLAGMQDRALPDLDENIKCGNSLIGPDFYDKIQMSFLEEEDEYRINVFPWQEAFPEVFKGRNPGFDAVVGNPPYIRIQALKEFAPVEVEYYKEAYRTATRGNYDIYVVFVEKGLSLLRKGGSLGYILPHKFFNAQYGESLRALVSQGRHLNEIVDFGDEQVFPRASTYTCLLFLHKAVQDQFRYSRVRNLLAWRVRNEAIDGVLPAEAATPDDWHFFVGPGAGLFNRLSAMPVTLGDLAERIFQGLVTGADPVFILTDHGDGSWFSEATGQEHRIEPQLLHRLCKGSVNIRRYRIEGITKSILFPYELVDDKAALLSPTDLKLRFPQTWAYLESCRSVLEGRERGKWKHERWYAFGRSQNLNAMEQKKILTPSIANAASYTLDEDDHYFVGSGGGGGGGYGITLSVADDAGYLYLLGLLNSRLLDTYLKTFSSRFRGGYYAYNRQYIEQLPIYTIDFSNPNEKALHGQLVALVEKMLELHKRLSAARSPNDRNLLQRQIRTTDHQIDRLVYDLYGLTDEEIEIVESETAPGA